MGRARKRARTASTRPAAGRPAADRERHGRPAAGGPPPDALTITGAAGTPGERRLHDPAWRKAERRRVMLLSLLPGPPQAFARRGIPQLVAVVLLHALLVAVAGLLIARAVSGEWLPSSVGLVVLGVAVASQFASRAINLKVSP